MRVIPKKSITPIFVPGTLYTDRFGNTNQYVEMNPAFWISSSGVFTILVRTVNYLKYKGNQFTVYGSSSRSIYHIVKGHIEDGPLSLDEAETSLLDVKVDVPTYPSLWYGLEDIRFVSETEVLACVPEMNEGRPGLFKATLNSRTISEFQPCRPSYQEKNWMPFGVNKVLYSVCPFHVKSIQEDVRQEVPLSDAQKRELEGWHGSSNGIPWCEGTLFLIHKNQERVYHRWLFYDNKQRIEISDPFVFFRESVLEFVCSLVEHKGRLFVSIGVNDNKAFVLELEKDTVNVSLT
jgi:hypothetical protein